MKILETQYSYRPLAGNSASCGVQIYQHGNQRPVLILTHFPWHPPGATSITNMIGILTAEVVQRYLSLFCDDILSTLVTHDQSKRYVPAFDLVEHYYASQDAIWEERFHWVTFDPSVLRQGRVTLLERLRVKSRPEGKVVIAKDWHGRWSMGNPWWGRATRKMVEELIGEPYKDDFRAKVQGSADPLTREIVTIVRDKAVPLTQVGGPLLALNVDHKYAEPLYGYGTLYLLMDGRWWYCQSKFKSGNGNDILTDQEVAERFPLNDLVIQLLESHRATIDGCVRQLKMRSGSPEFQADLGAYLTQEGAYMLAHLDWLHRSDVAELHDCEE